MAVAVRWQRAEGAALLAVAALAYGRGDMGWGVFALLFLVPDLSMLGYLAGPRAGAMAYNAAHALIGPVVLLAAGLLIDVRPELTVPLGWIWMAHIGFDRLLGYGLKSPDAFGITHLGLVGRVASPE